MELADVPRTIFFHRSYQSRVQVIVGVDEFLSKSRQVIVLSRNFYEAFSSKGYHYVASLRRSTGMNTWAAFLCGEIPCVFISDRVQGEVNIASVPVLLIVYDPVLIRAGIDPKFRVLHFFLTSSEFFQLRQEVPRDLAGAWHFRQRPGFSFPYHRNRLCLLDSDYESSHPMAFPDLREPNPLLISEIREAFESRPCPICGAVSFKEYNRTKVRPCACTNCLDSVVDHLPGPMLPDDRKALEIESKKNANFPRILNWKLRPILQNAKVNSRRGPGSCLFISGVPYAIDEFGQFTGPVYAIFNQLEKQIETPYPEILYVLIRRFLSRNPVLSSYVRERLDYVQQLYAQVSLPGTSHATDMNLAIFNSEGTALEPHVLQALKPSYKAKRLPPWEMDYDQLIYPLIFWNGRGGCGARSGSGLQGATAIMRKSAICLILQPRTHHIHSLATLREEFICAMNGRLLNVTVHYQALCQRRYFRRQDELNLDQEIPKEYGLRSFLPASLPCSSSYWRNVARRCFCLSGSFGPPTFFLTFTMNPYWPDYQALKKGAGEFCDGATASRVFKLRLRGLLRYITQRRVLGTVAAYVWRIEYQQRGLPHAHLLLWTNLDTSDISALESVVNVRLPLPSPFIEDLEREGDLRELIQAFQVHHHSPRCRDSSGHCRFGYPQPVVGETCITSSNRFVFARNRAEAMIVPHNLELLARFRCHQCLEPIHSDQCIGYILKYCSKNSDDVDVNLNLRYEGRPVASGQKLERWAASRVISAAECFSAICGDRRYRISPGVLYLPIHLPGKRVILAATDEQAREKAELMSELERYLARPEGTEFDVLTYADYYARYSIGSKTAGPDSCSDRGNPPRSVSERKKEALAMLETFPPFNHEGNALRLLLRHVPARSWEDLRRVGAVTCSTFLDAAVLRGLIIDKFQEAYLGLQEAINLHRPPSDLRFLFAQYVTCGANFDRLFGQFSKHLCDFGQTAQEVFTQVRMLLSQMGFNMQGLPNFWEEELPGEEGPPSL